jgi:hypothetical protein
VTVAEALPALRETLRVADCPFGPVTVEFTLPLRRVADRVALLPFGPVTVPVEVVCACAIPIASVNTNPCNIFVEIVIGCPLF